jgi:REP element-mobilizing transposase RayT
MSLPPVASPSSAFKNISMFIQPYTVHELDLAYCNRVYLRFRSHRRKEIAGFTKLTKQLLSDLLMPYGIHLLEFTATDVDIRILVSLQATESVSVATSKIKGRLSKWISDNTPNQSPDEKHKWFGRGYFATTVGHTRTAEVSAYLDRQASHHHYDQRQRPPCYVESFDLNETLLATDHAVTRLRFHIVLATEQRQGVFHDASAPCVTAVWRKLQPEMKSVIEKVSFLPDHVHLAISVHPIVSPVTLVAELMNQAQNIIWENFEKDVVRANVTRLWQSGAYVGSFGDLQSAAMAAYVKKWDAALE